MPANRAALRRSLTRTGVAMLAIFAWGHSLEPAGVRAAVLQQAPGRAGNAAIETGFDGAWGGTLDANGTKLRLSLRLANGAGTLVSIDQGNATFPVSVVTQAGTRLVFNVPSISGSFAGDLQDGQIVGIWSQGLAALPLTFERTASSPVSIGATGSAAGAQPPAAVTPAAPLRPPAPQPAGPDPQPAAAPPLPGPVTALATGPGVDMMTLTSSEGLSVEIPADWQRTGDSMALAPDSWGQVILKVGGAPMLAVENAERNAQFFKAISHPSGRIHFRKSDVPPLGSHYSILVKLGDRAAYFTCREAAGSDSGPAGCLTIARTARFGGSPPGGAAPTRPAAGSRQLAATPPQSATAEGEEVLAHGGSFGNVPVGTTTTFRVLCARAVDGPEPSINAVAASGPSRNSEFVLHRPEPAKGRRIAGTQITPECRGDPNCVLPISFTPATKSPYVILHLNCGGANTSFRGTVR